MTEVSRAAIVLEVQGDVERDLKRAERSFDATKRRIDRQRASMDIDANIRPLQKKVEQAENKVDEFSKKVRDRAKLGLNTTQAEKALRNWERKLKEARSARDEVKLDDKKARKALLRLQQLEDNLDQARTRANEAVLDGIRKVDKAREEAARREEERQEKAEYDMERLHAKALEINADIDRKREAAAEKERARKEKEEYDMERLHHLALQMDAERDRKAEELADKERARKEKEEYDMERLHHKALQMDAERDQKLQDLADKEQERKEKAEYEMERLHHKALQMDEERDQKLQEIADRAQARREKEEYEMERLHHKALELDAERDRKKQEAEDKARYDAEKTHHVALRMDAERDRRLAEAAARRQAASDREHQRNVDAYDREFQAITGLQQQYVKLQQTQKKLERDAKRLSLSPNARINVQLEERSVEERMAMIRARLKAMNVDPIEINVDVDEESGNILAKWARTITETTVRLGPFTTTIAGATRALALLGPLLIGVVGTLSALTASLGAATTGLIGFAGAAGLGFAGVAAGVFAVTKPLLTDLKNINSLADAYHKQVLKTGANSEKAKEKLDEYNNALKEIPSTTRTAFLEGRKLSKQWRDMTSERARPIFFKTYADGIRTIQKMMPMLADASLSAFEKVAAGARGWMKSLRSSSALNLLGQFFQRTNAAIEPLMSGLGRFAAAIVRIANSFARHFEPLAEKFATWAGKFNKSLSDEDGVAKLDARVDKLMGSLAKVTGFFKALGRVIFQFLRGGLSDGNKMFGDMTDSLNKTADAMSTVAGQKKLHDFFAEATETGRKFFKVILTLINFFIKFTTVLDDVTQAILPVINWVGRLVTGILSIGPLKGMIEGVFALFLTGVLIGKVMQLSAAFVNLAKAIRAVGGAGAASAVGSWLGNKTGITAGRNAWRRGAPMPIPAPATYAPPGPGQTFTKGNPLNAGANQTKGGVVLPAGVNPNTAKNAAQGAKAMTVMKGAAAGLLPALTGLSLPMLGLAAGAAAVGYGLYKAVKAQGRYKETAKAAANEAKKFNQNIHQLDTLAGGVAGATNGIAQAELNVKQAQSEVTRTQREVNKLRKDGKTGTQAYKDAQMAAQQASLNLRSAQMQEYQMQEELNRVTSEYESARRKAGAAARNGLNEAKGALKEFQDSNFKNSWVEKLTADDIPAMTDAIRQFKKTGEAEFNGMRLFGKDVESLEKMLSLLKGVQAAEYNVRREAELAFLGTLNMQRAARGLVPMAEKAAGHFAEINRRTGNRKLSTQIALKYDDPNKAAKVGQRAAAALRAGASTRLVQRIIANTSDVDEALRKLARVELKTKVQRIVERGGSEAVAWLERIMGRRLTDKEFRIAQKGGPDALALLGRILKTKIGDKRFAAIIRDLASGRIASIKDLIDRLRDKTVTIRTREISERVGGKAVQGTGKVINDYAGGAHGRDTNKMIWEAGRSAGRLSNAARVAPGGRYNKPTYLIGEEHRREYVISTNPAYRQSNVAYIKDAAGEFGYKLTPAFGGTATASAKKKKKKTERKNNKGTDTKKKLWQPPESYRAGAVPLDEARKEMQDAANLYKQRDRRENQIIKRLADYKEDLKKAPGKKKKGIRTKIEKAERELKYVRRGNDNAKKDDPDRLSKAQLKTAADRAKSKYEAVKKINDEIDKQEAEVNRQGSIMRKHSILFEKYGKPEDETAWTTAKGKREAALSTLRDLFANAAKLAKPGAFRRELLQKAADNDADLTDSQETGALTGPPERSFEDFVNAVAAERQQDYAKLRADLAVAKTNNVQDDPGTEKREDLDALQDDRAAATVLRDFFGAVLAKAQTTGDYGLIEEAATAFTSAKDELQGIEEAFNDAATKTGPTQGQLAAIELSSIRRDYGSNMVGDAGGRTAAGGFASTGVQVNSAARDSVIAEAQAADMRSMQMRRGLMAGSRAGSMLMQNRMGAMPGATPQSAPSRSTNVTVNNSFQAPPPDPHTWSRGLSWELGGAI